MTRPVIRTSNSIEVRQSDIHGSGVFAVEPIAAGTYIIEYFGELITDAEADRRAEENIRITGIKNHTFLFAVDDILCIDGSVGGNDSRFINHSCDPNCEAEVVDRRVFILALKNIAEGQELTLDYSLTRGNDDPPDMDQIYSCLCGSTNCRGTMMEAVE